MASSNFAVKYRPIKIGFLARAGSIEDLVAAAKLNTLLWGGVHNPILPVSGDNEQNEKFIRSIPVDVLYPLSEATEVGHLLRAFPFLKGPHRYDLKILVEEWRSKKNELAYLDALSVIERYYQKYFRGICLAGN